MLLVGVEEGVDDEGRPIPDDSSHLAAALEASGLALDRVTPVELSPALTELGNYAGIVLVNVNAKDPRLNALRVISIVEHGLTSVLDLGYFHWRGGGIEIA